MTSIYRVLLSLTLLSLSLSCFADAAAIEGLENKVASLQQQIKDNSASIESYQAKYEKVSVELEEAKVALADADISFNTATANHDGDPSSENARALRKASDSKKLAERKVGSKQKRAEWLSNEIKQLEANSNSAKKEISQSSSKIASVKAQWKNKIKQQEDAAAKAVAAKRAQAAAKPEITKPKLPTVAPTPSGPVLAQSAKTSPPPPQEKTSSQGQKIAEFNQYLSSPSISQEPNIKLRIGFSDKSGRIKFEHLGGEIYKGEVKLNRGKQVINYDGSSFRIEVDRADNKKVHVVYFDNRNKDKRSLVVLEKSLVK